MYQRLKNNLPWKAIDPVFDNFEISAYFYGGDDPYQDAKDFALEGETVFLIDVELRSCRFMRAWACGKRKA